MKSILLVPSIRRKGGTGHIVRCLRVLKELGNEGFILLPEAGTDTEWSYHELSGMIHDQLKKRVVHDIEKSRWDLIVLDRRETPVEFLDSMRCFGHIIGLDEGGAARPLFDYLIDAFPRLRNDVPNISNQGFLVDGPSQTRMEKNTGRVLLTFGGEDPADLTHLVYRHLIASGRFARDSIHVAEGHAFGTKFTEPCGEVIRHETELRKRFHLYDLVFTSYGLTPYEVIQDGSIPVLVNPSPYHEKLSRKSGFFSLGVKKVSKKLLKKVLDSPETALINPQRHTVHDSPSLGVFLLGLTPPNLHECPGCGHTGNPGIQRFLDKTFFRCSFCGLEYLERFSAQTKKYDADYFFREYSEQYGKTYLQDFESISNASKRRLSVIRSLDTDIAGKNLLDVGCAYGPFLKAAMDAGIKAHGVDICEDAVNYILDELEIPAAAGDFREISLENIFGIRTFDIISLWYVIEHFPDLKKTLAKISSLVREGGWLLLSTPNSHGVSGIFFSKSFHEKSPSDHFTVWDKKSAGIVLGLYGFEVRKIIVTGHHPERFPHILRMIFGEKICGSVFRSG